MIRFPSIFVNNIYFTGPSGKLRVNNRPLNYNVGKCPYIAVPESLIERYGFAGSFVWNRIIMISVKMHPVLCACDLLGETLDGSGI